MVTNNFNGRVYIESQVKSGLNYEMELSFMDLTSFWRGRDCQIGDIVFCRGSDGKGYRLIVTAIKASSLNHISVTVQPESTTLRFIPPQYCAIFRETINRKFPMFPVGVPVALRAIMESYYAVIDDTLTEGECKGLPIGRQEIVGDETLCLKQADGTQRTLSLTELREWILTLTNSTDENYRLGIGYMGVMCNLRV